jgi:acyl-CoA-binding protein
VHVVIFSYSLGFSDCSFHMFLRSLLAVFALATGAFASVQELFERAVEFSKDKSRPAPGLKMKTKFYGAYKQATEGPCTLPEPSKLDIKAYAKWSAWTAMEKKSKEEAMGEYVALMDNQCPGWRD